MLISKEFKPEKNLIIAAHPDDETIGCSSILKDSVIFLFTNPDQRRMKIFDDMCDRYNIPNVKFDLEALKLDTYGSHHLLNLLENAYIHLSKVFDIKNVFGHYSQDLHQDHQVLAKVTDIFCRRRNKNFSGYYQYFTDNSFPTENIILNESPIKVELLQRYNSGLNSKHYDYIIKFSEMLKEKYQTQYIPDAFVCKYRIGL